MRRLERSGASVTQQCISVYLRKQRTNDGGSIITETLGKPLIFSLNKKGNLRNSMPTLTVEKTFELQREFNFTQRQVLRLLRFARRNITRGFVPPYLPSMMKLKRCIFSDLFVSTTMPMEQKKTSAFPDCSRALH